MVIVKALGLTAACTLLALNLQAQVTISAPENGATVSSPVQLTAGAAQSASFLVYSNGSLVFQQQGVSSISTSLTLTAGLHTILIKTTPKGGASSTATSVITVTPPEPGPFSDVGSELASDMTGKNEGYPQGVPLTYAWANGPVVVMGNNPTGWKAITAWGVVYVASQGNLAVNTRVNIRDMQTYVLLKSTSKWLLLQNTSAPAGAAYLDDFSTTVNVPGDVRTEPDGTISVTAGTGYNYHFYPSVRGSINPNDIGGIVTIFQARLIVANPALPDDRGISAYLAGAGGDYYPALTGSWPGNLPYNPGIAIGKEKYVKTFWRFYSMSTLTTAQLKSNPPPVVLTGILP